MAKAVPDPYRTVTGLRIVARKDCRQRPADIERHESFGLGAFVVG